MTKSYQKVSIIILNWNGLKDTIECLESIKKSDYPNYEIILVDNASKIREGEIIKSKFPELELLQNEINLGFTGGNNIGMRYALNRGADYVWLLNNDTVVEPETLDQLILAAEKYPQAGLLSPVIYFYSKPNKIQFCGVFVDFDNFCLQDIKTLEDLQNASYNHMYLWGTGLLIKRKTVESIGYLNDKFFAYDEDIDYSLRSLRAGFSNMIVPSAKLFHKFHYIDKEGYDNFPEHFYYYVTRNRFWFFSNNLPIWKKILFFKKYLIKIIKKVGALNENSLTGSVDACLDGLYHAILNLRGGHEISACVCQN